MQKSTIKKYEYNEYSFYHLSVFVEKSTSPLHRFFDHPGSIVLTSLLLGTEEASSTGMKAGIFVFSVCLYEPVLVAFTGGTLGHRLLGLRIKNYHDQDRNISLLSAFGRVIVKGLLGWLSFVTITFNPQKRGIHDIATGSIVRLK